MSKPLGSGEACLIVDAKGRSYLITLREGGEFQYHAGVLAHDGIIGATEGTVFEASSGARLVALRPRLADYILRMKRGPQVVYPKDLGPIVVWADIGPGMVVVEAGTGSGALAMALLRAVGPSGRVVSVERRPDHAELAAAAIARFFGGMPENLELRVGEVADALAAVAPDRVVLDVPTPWEVLPAVTEHMAPGGVFAAYVPTVPQIQQVRQELRHAKCYVAIETFEVLHREWVAEGRSVRPEHHMVAHTGFITVARKTAPLAERSAGR